MNFKAEWGSGPDFAEIAEALGVPTNMVLSAMNWKGRIVTMYSPDEENPREVWTVQLARDADGILVKFGEPEEVPGFWEAIEAALDERLGDG